MAGKDRKSGLADTRLKIAVFIDFDNIEIGVKSTLGVQFDVGVVLEALKERGDVVSKIAYGDWTRAGDYSRSLTQHATKLVQRNLTPGGDKNGADINLALDALEMAFTHGHINAYVIVGGDSDFITLVEKLKQYDKQIFVVGGRAFTSLVMQRNCHEFIAYENLVGSRRSQERGRQAGPPVAVTQASLEQAVPLVRRALKVLADREVSPQLGLLKSTLLQLDSTFSERTYGAGSFRDFAQKLAAGGFVTLKEHGRNVLVEFKEGVVTRAEEKPPAAAAPPAPEPAAEDEQPPAAPLPEPRVAEGIREVRKLFQSAQNPPRWPMYIRQAKQFLRNVDASFDERRFGFASLVDLMRACQREGMFRIERDRQGVMRLFPGNVMQYVPDAVTVEPGDLASDEDGERDQPPAHTAPVRVPRREPAGEDDDQDAEPELPLEDAAPSAWAADQSMPSAGREVVEGDVLQDVETPAVVDGETADGQKAAARPRGRKRAPARSGNTRKTAGESAGGTAPRTRKTSTPRATGSRSRARKTTPSE